MVPGAAAVLVVLCGGGLWDPLPAWQGADRAAQTAELDARLGGPPLPARSASDASLASGPLPHGLAEIGVSLAYVEAGRAKLHSSLGQSRGNLGPLDGAEGQLRLRYAFTAAEDRFWVAGLLGTVYQGDAGSFSSSSTAPGSPPTAVQNRFTLDAESAGVFAMGGGAIASSDRFLFLVGEIGVGGLSSRTRLEHYGGANPAGSGRFASAQDLLPAGRAALTIGLNLPGSRLRGAVRRDLGEEADPGAERNWRRRTVFGLRFTASYTVTPDVRVDFRDGGRAMHFDATGVSIAFGISWMW